MCRIVALMFVAFLGWCWESSSVMAFSSEFLIRQQEVGECNCEATRQKAMGIAELDLKQRIKDQKQIVEMDVVAQFQRAIKDQFPGALVFPVCDAKKGGLSFEIVWPRLPSRACCPMGGGGSNEMGL